MFNICSATPSLSLDSGCHYDCPLSFKCSQDCCYPFVRKHCRWYMWSLCICAHRERFSATHKWELCVCGWQLLLAILSVILKGEDFWPRLCWIHWPCKMQRYWKSELIQSDVTSYETHIVGKHRNSIKKYGEFLAYTRMSDTRHHLIPQNQTERCPCMHCFILSLLDFCLLIKAFKP